MIIFFIVVIIIFVIGVTIYLSKIVKEEKEFIVQENKENEEKRLASKTIAQKLQETGSEESYQSLLNEVKNSEEKIDELKIAIQNELRSALKNKDGEKARLCNRRLKELDQYRRG